MKVREYIQLNGSLLAIRERDVATNLYTWKYQHNDALGSPVAVTNSSGNEIEIERTKYEPYGLADPSNDGPGYTGHVEDASTGLTYMEQRYYDPSIGRFLSVDPVDVDPQSGFNFNRYWYANNNPYRFKDPDGRWTAVVYDNAGTGHIGFWTERGGANGVPTVYDPNGSFSAGYVAENVELADYVAYQEQAGGDVEVIWFDTSEGEETALIAAAEELWSSGTLDCAARTAAALSAIPRFQSIEPTIWPANLAKQVRRLSRIQSKLKKPRPKPKIKKPKPKPKPKKSAANSSSASS